MAKKPREYYGEDITVQFEFKRCIHAAECIRRLPEVFDRARRPWVLPDMAEAGDVAEAVMHCPSGALHFERKDGGAAESKPEHNTILLMTNGPLYVSGDVEVVDPEGSLILQDTRIALCRCGSSQNKPLCDNSHQETRFRAMGSPDSKDVRMVEPTTDNATLKVIPSVDGPFELHGDVALQDRKGRTFFQGSQVYLCRCGASKNKPFCDNSHRSEQGGVVVKSIGSQHNPGVFCTITLNDVRQLFEILVT